MTHQFPHYPRVEISFTSPPTRADLLVLQAVAFLIHPNDDQHEPSPLAFHEDFRGENRHYVFVTARPYLERQANPILDTYCHLVADHKEWSRMGPDDVRRMPVRVIEELGVSHGFSSAFHTMEALCKKIIIHHARTRGRAPMSGPF